MSEPVIGRVVVQPTIVLAGAAGDLGTRIAEALVAHGAVVRVLVRHDASTADRDRLTVINHPITGPVFSGPHEQPFVCETETAGLGAPLDSDCSVATHHETRPDGVRFETGTINRGIYEIAVPAEMVVIEKLPILGTGKVDMVGVTRLAKERVATQAAA